MLNVQMQVASTLHFTLYVFYIKVRKVFAASRKLMMRELGETLFELGKQTLAWSILVGIHVERRMSLVN